MYESFIHNYEQAPLKIDLLQSIIYNVSTVVQLKRIFYCRSHHILEECYSPVFSIEFCYSRRKFRYSQILNVGISKLLYWSTCYALLLQPIPAIENFFFITVLALLMNLSLVFFFFSKSGFVVASIPLNVVDR